MIRALFDDHDITSSIFSDDKPCFARSSDTKTFALTDRVKSDATMLTYDFPISIFEISRVVRDVVGEKGAEVAFSDKADAGAIFFCRSDKSMLCSKGSYLLFLKMSNRKKSFF